MTGAADETVSIRLYNMLGSTVKEMHYKMSSGSNTVKMNLAGIQLSSGNYYLMLQGDNGYKTVKKVTIIR